MSKRSKPRLQTKRKMKMRCQFPLKVPARAQNLALKMNWVGLGFLFPSVSFVFASSSWLSCCFAGFVPSYAVLSLTCSISELALPIILFFFLFLIFSFCALFLFHASFVLPSVLFPFFSFSQSVFVLGFAKAVRSLQVSQSQSLSHASFSFSYQKERSLSFLLVFSFFRSVFAPPSSISFLPSCIFTAVFFCPSSLSILTIRFRSEFHDDRSGYLPHLTTDALTTQKAADR